MQVRAVKDDQVEMIFKELEFIMSHSDTLPTVMSEDDCEYDDDSFCSFPCIEDELPSLPAKIIEEEEDDNDIHSYYVISPHVLGEGQSGIVKECIDKETGEHFAVKTITKRNNRLSMDLIRQEVELLSQVHSHKNIISIIEVFEDSDYFHIVTELCRGGELFEAIAALATQKDPFSSSTLFSEAQAARIIYSILDAVAYLHDKDIVHRDLKPENLLVENDTLQLIDFGFAVTHDDCYDAPLSDLVGTPYYMAPEVLKRSYNKACDMWSVGVIAYVLLFGQPPFNGRNDPEIFDKIRRGHFSMNGIHAMSDESKDFIKCLLRRDPRKRWTAEQAMRHPWMAQQLRMPSI